MSQWLCGHCHWRVVFFNKFTWYVNNVQVCGTCHKRFITEYRAAMWDAEMNAANRWEPIEKYPTHKELESMAE